MQSSSTMLCCNENEVGLLNGGSSERASEDSGLAVHEGIALKQKPANWSPMISVGHSSRKDNEAPMPPPALAPLMHTRNEYGLG